jgi:U3 small nucleolar RNA-associated protein 18
VLGGTLELTRMRDANMRERSKAVVQTVSWHPNAQLLLTAGFDKRLRLYSVDGVHNSVVQSVYLQDLPVKSACFACGGATVVAAGRRKFFYVWDVNSQALERVTGLQGFAANSLETLAAPPPAISADAKACVAFTGNDGTVGLVSLLSRQLVGTVKMNGEVRCAAFDPTGVELYTAGTDGRVCIWDVRTRRCLHSFADEGCIKSTALAVSHSTAAAASGAGIVNIHPRWAPAVPGRCSGKPLRALDNLVTLVDTLEYSPDGSMLCMASRMQKDALRIVHVPSLTVFSNWPTSRTPLGHVHCASFSPGGGLLAIGNSKGHVLTYRLHSFGQI